MSEVKLVIHGKEYSLDCDPGQEQRILDLGMYVDQKAKELGGAMNEGQRLMLASLMLADELFETKDQLNVVQKASPATSVVQDENGVSAEETEALAKAINQMAIRIDSLATRLEKV